MSAPSLHGVSARRYDFALVFASVLIASFGLTSQSLWIDEANAALKAVQPSFTSWSHLLVSEKGSDLQMPIYMLYLWAWEKAAGHSELALRCANVPWLVLAQYSLCRACRYARTDPIPLLGISALNPFLWYYMNEARPYVMQYAASAMIVCNASAFLANGAQRKLEAWLFALGVLVLASSSMLGMAWAGCAVFAVGFICYRRRELPRVAPLASAVTLLLCFAVYYLWTLRLGARGSGVGSMSIANLIFVTYELLGFSGLGPGRLELRSAGQESFRPFLLPLLLLALSIGVVFWFAIRRIVASSPRDKALAALIYGAVPALCLVALGFSANFRLLGRHFTPVAPLLCILLACGVVGAARSRVRATFTILWLILWVGSALSLRSAPRHAKDDYRGAAQTARAALAQRERVWWAADRAAAAYYSVEARGDLLTFLANPTLVDFQRLPAPDVVVLSKPDLYDASGALTAFLRQHDYHRARTLQAFSVWLR